MEKKFNQKGIVLISADKNDPNLVKVIDWLLFSKAKIIVINEDSKITFSSFLLSGLDSKLVIEINGFELNLSEIKSYWFRNGNFNIIPSNISKSDDEILYLYYENYFKSELPKLRECFLTILENGCDRTILNRERDININKLEVLILAAKIGFTIPKTIIADNKYDVRKFFNSMDEIITKGINNSRMTVNNKVYWSSSKIVKIDSLDDNFLPSIFQEYINKEIDIRVFIIRNDVYSGAIFSQSNEKTKIDFRTYDFERPNRIVPFCLPKTIKENLQKLILELGIVSCVADILYTKSNFYFLEINPFGQYSDISQYCNFNLNEKISNYLWKTK